MITLLHNIMIYYLLTNPCFMYGAIALFPILKYNDVLAQL